ncbi:MAG: BON domain-containing protein [Pyrinomonadaceae bacterium]|nr:BON domain-containing protein [Pyrinomonadaceae bacterium]
MAYDEEHHKRSRVVVETPAARREVVETRTAYAAPERRGVSTGVVAIVAIAAVVLTAIVAWALTRPSADELNANVRVAAQPTPVTQVVTVPVPQQQPVVMPPAPATTTTTTQPVIVPVPTTTSSSSTSSTGTDDGTIQSNIEKKFSDDPKIAALGITVSVIDGKVTLIGTVDSREMKNRLERMARIKGVKSVDNQIIVSGADSTTQD